MSTPCRNRIPIPNVLKCTIKETESRDAAPLYSATITQAFASNNPRHAM